MRSVSSTPPLAVSASLLSRSPRYLQKNPISFPIRPPFLPLLFCLFSLLQALGATVIATAGSAEKLEICQKNGADFCINYRDKDWTQQVKNLTNGHGADVIYDPVGLVDERYVRWESGLVMPSQKSFANYAFLSPLA